MLASTNQVVAMDRSTADAEDQPSRFDQKQR
jgi:hypothetical protein